MCTLTCPYARTHATLSPSSFLFLTHTHTHGARPVGVVFWQECTYTNSNYLRCWGGRAERLGGDPSSCREPSGSVMNCCSARHIRVCERVLAMMNELRSPACVPAAFMSAQLQIVWLFNGFARRRLRLCKHVLWLKSSCSAQRRI